MQENSHKISASQLFCILLLIRVSAEMVYPSVTGFGGTGLASALAAEVIRFLAALPVLVYSFKGREFYAAIWRKNRFLGWASAVGAALLLAAAAVRTLICTAGFVQRTMLNRTPELLIALLLAGFGAYAALRGSEALARAGVLFLAAAGVVTLLAVIADIPEMKRLHDLPEWSAGVFAGDFIERLLRGGEYLVFAALLPYVRTGDSAPRKRSGAAGMLFAAASAVIAAGLCVFYAAVLGEYSGMTEYPIAAASSLADIVLFKRLDGLVCAIWALGAAFRVGLMAFSAWAVVRECGTIK